MSMNVPTSRRTFLSTASAFATGTALATRTASARERGLGHYFISDTIANSRHGAAAFLPPPMPAEDLRRYATAAIDAARSAGAAYADVRVAEKQSLTLDGKGTRPVVRTVAEYGYGLRALVNGTWNFGHGIVPSVDAMATAARNTVATARVLSRLTKQPTMLAPAPAVTGDWTMPIQLDPFTVPIQDQAALLNAYASAAGRRRYVGMHRSVEWTRELRVFANSEGSLLTQQRWGCAPFCLIMGDYGMGGVYLRLPELNVGRSGGYETLAIAGLPDVIDRTAEEAVRLARLPRGSMDVGRYPVVMDGASTAGVFVRTVNSALELDRVLGTEADASGTSFLGPVDELLGTPVVSPNISVRAHRQMPSLCAAKWDDEGVEVEPYSVIEAGRLVDYHTSRDTAPALQAAYQQRNIPMRSRGCAVAPSAADAVMVRTPHTTIAPNPVAKSVDDLCQEMGKGVLALESVQVSCDPSLASGMMPGFAMTMLEVARGKPVRRLEGNHLMFQTKKLWNNVVALGDVTTARGYLGGIYFGSIKGIPWRTSPMSGSAPATFFKEINVIGGGR